MERENGLVPISRMAWTISRLLHKAMLHQKLSADEITKATQTMDTLQNLINITFHGEAVEIFKQTGLMERLHTVEKYLDSMTMKQRGNLHALRGPIQGLLHAISMYTMGMCVFA